MKLLLDTHSLLWFLSGDSKLSQLARNSIEDNSNEKFVSAGSLWETAIKVSIGKIKLTAAFEELFPGQLDQNGFDLLPVLTEHVRLLTTMPFHHRDPFDRLFVAQSMAGDMTIVSTDDIFDSYGIARIW